MNQQKTTFSPLRQTLPNCGYSWQAQHSTSNGLELGMLWAPTSGDSIAQAKRATRHGFWVHAIPDLHARINRRAGLINAPW